MKQPWEAFAGCFQHRAGPAQTANPRGHVGREVCADGRDGGTISAVKQAEVAGGFVDVARFHAEHGARPDC